MLAACVGFLVLVLALTRVLMRGSFRPSLMAIRDNETAAEALGKNVMVLKTLAVMLGCAYAGIGGALYSAQMQFINVESFTLDQSVLIMAMGSSANLHINRPARWHRADPPAARGAVLHPGHSGDRDRCRAADDLRAGDDR